MIDKNEIYKTGAKLGKKQYKTKDWLILADGHGGASERSVNLSEALEHIWPDTIIQQYNQNEMSKYYWDCSNYGPMFCITSLTGYVFTAKDKSEIHDLAVDKYEFEEGVGNYVINGVECVTDWYNKKHPNDKVIFYRFSLRDEKIVNKLIKKGKAFVVGLHTSREHSRDSQDNGRLDKKSFKYAPKRGGHILSHYKGQDVDNYYGRKKYNIYTNKYIVNYSREGTYFYNGYVFMKATPGPFKDVPANHVFAKRIKSISDKGIMNGYGDGNFKPSDPITRGEFTKALDEAINFLLKELKK